MPIPKHPKHPGRDSMNDAIRFAMWMPQALRDDCQQAANADDRSLSDWARLVMKRAASSASKAR